jgi:hypothetical protein
MRDIKAGTIGLVLLAVASAAQAGGESALGAVETFFEALADNNGELAKTVMIEDAVLYGYRIEVGEVKLGRVNAADYLASMSERSDQLLERIWDVEILQHDRLATVWTPYDFYLNGEFHHCGRNSFGLIRDDSGWRIASVVYSMLTDGCEESPLGPPDSR